MNKKLEDLFFLKAVKGNKFSCLKVNFTDKGMNLSSQPDEHYMIEYRNVISCSRNELLILGDKQFSSLKISFISHVVVGIFNLTQQIKVQQIVLYSMHPIRISHWVNIFNQLRSDYQLTDKIITQIQAIILYKEIPIEWWQRNHILEEVTMPEINADIEGEIAEKICQQLFENKKLLVFVNPASGKVTLYQIILYLQGVAQQKWNEAQVVLAKSNFTFNVVLTDLQNQCKDYLKNIPKEVSSQMIYSKELLQYRGIVFVSGDSLPHEGINALFSRSDWKEVTQVPVGVLPVGSGNGLANSLAKQSGLEMGLQENTFLIGKEHTRNIDLVLLEIAGKRIFSFLNVSWAYTADIDFSSETLSFLGSAKFEVYGMFRGILKKDYPASLQFTSKNFDFNESQLLLEKTPLFSKVQDEDWTDLGQTDFSYFLATKQPYLSQDFYCSPLAKLDDGKNVLNTSQLGFIDLQYLKSSEGWTALTSLAISSQSGNHISQETQQVPNGKLWKYEKVSAFRLHPTNSTCPYSIDGERYNSNNQVDAVVVPKILKVFSL